jgi:L-lactate dehydrogenase complex protein LldF
VPTLEDVATLMRLLPRSATGQSISNYVSVTTGTRSPGDLDGPEQFHVILLDGGRSKILASEFSAILRCIRCGACMNHCPVYQSVGGHAYGWVYPGPMGAVLTPNYVGIENALDLPHAATLCNQCGVVCPVKIPLPELMRKLREKQYERGLRPWHERFGLAAWSALAAHPKAFAAITGIAVKILAWMGGKRGMIARLPFGGGWTDGRDMPAPEGKTFRALYANRSARRMQ